MPPLFVRPPPTSIYTIRTGILSMLLLLLPANAFIHTSMHVSPRRLTSGGSNVCVPASDHAMLSPWSRPRSQYGASALDNTENNERPSTMDSSSEPLPGSTIVQYNSPLFPPQVLDSLWNQQRKPLLRLGAKGVLKSHLNSLRELLDAHNVVRVKVNGLSNTDIQGLAENALRMAVEHDSEPALGVLLRVKGKEFLVGRPDKMEALRKKLLSSDGPPGEAIK
uniref:Uncharacterized protein n=2 Tax=Nannochloropsis gaditana (strain CCMP526) TaxID=1093141 RepID=I2CPM2_NANGC